MERSIAVAFVILFIEEHKRKDTISAHRTYTICLDINDIFILIDDYLHNNLGGLGLFDGGSESADSPRFLNGVLSLE